KIVDVGHPAFKAFFRVAGQIDLAEELRRRGLALVILFIATPDATAVEAFAQLQRDFPSASILPVHNDVLGATQHRDKITVSVPGSKAIYVPALAPGLRKIIDRLPFSFGDPRGGAAELPLET